MIKLTQKKKIAKIITNKTTIKKIQKKKIQLFP